MNSRLMLRMIAPTAAISLLLLAVGVGTAWHVHLMQEGVSNTLLVNVSSMRAAEELEISVREMRTQLHQYLLTSERASLEGVYPLRPEVERWLIEAVRWSTTEHEQVLMKRVGRGLERFDAELAGAVAEPPAERARHLRELIDGHLLRDVIEPTHAYLDFNEKELEKSSGRNRVLAGRLIFVLLLLGISGSAAGLVAGLGLARTMSRSLIQLSVPVRAAAGQLAQVDEVVGPITFAASWDLHQLEGVLHLIANRVAAIVERLRQSERELLRAEQLATVGQMAAGMAHELRNPLTSMKILVQAALARFECQVPGAEGRVPNEDPKSPFGTLHSLAGWPDDRPGHSPFGPRDLAVLEEEITRLERVIDTFLHFARPPEPEKRVVELRALVEGTVDLVAARAALCDVQLERDLPPEEVQAVVDPGQVRQVLLNLLLNALDAVAPGGQVRLRLKTCADAVVLRVEDTGCGLPAELGPRIFSPFVSTKETGLGLGLSISKRIAEAHGGILTAEAAVPPPGAVFIVTLPVEPRYADLVDRR